MIGRDVVVVVALRTPIGRRGGVLAGYHPVDLVAGVIEEVVRSTGVDPERIDDVILGCVDQVDEQALNVARSAALAAGLPITVPGVTVDRQCGSSQQAVQFAAQGIACGAYDLVLAGGVESMTRVPMYSNLPSSASAYGHRLRDRLGLSETEFLHQADGAEMLCDSFGLTRDDLDRFSVRSHELAAAARESGRFEREISPVSDGAGGVDTDEGIRPGTSIEDLGRLAPAFRPDGRLTAGNSSQISDGAAVLLLADRSTAKRLGLPARARLVSGTVVGSDPVVMVDGPIAATRRVLERSGMGLDQIDLFEVNEAFACVPLAWMKDLGVGLDRLNVSGGAVALGHPLGATGARIFVTLLNNLEQYDQDFGLVAICEGGGMANATIIERIEEA